MHRFGQKKNTRTNNGESDEYFYNFPHHAEKKPQSTAQKYYTQTKFEVNPRRQLMNPLS